MVDYVSALGTAAQALKLVQDLRNIEKAFDAAELRLKVADLTVALADLKIALTEARDEVQSKVSEIARLKALMVRTADMTEFKGFKYVKGSDGKPRGHAFCSVCEQKQGLLFNLAIGPGGNQFCPHCKSVFGKVHVFGQ